MAALAPQVASSVDIRSAATEQNPNVLAFYLSPRDAYRDVLFSKNEIFCSPDCDRSEDPIESRTVKTPVGRYDVQVVLKGLPRSATPDILVVKADGTLRNLPGNLDSIDCTKVLVLGDTHHLRSPITSLLTYAMTERFHVLVSDTNRQHVHFFRSAGFRRSHWLPNLTWSPHWREVRDHAKHDVVFVGQTGQFHPWRRAVLGEAAQRGLPVLVESLPQRDAADRYADSKVVLNCSLNGDLNLRVFEVLAAGGLLLTDELSALSGLPSLFEDGRHLAMYASVGDLVEKARYYLDHPERAVSVRARGREAVEAS